MGAPVPTHPPGGVADPRDFSKETPAELVCFDLLALGDESLMDLPFRDDAPASRSRSRSSRTATRST